MVSSILKFASLCSLAVAVPNLVARQAGVQTPNDGFPTPNMQQLMAIQQKARGLVPNTPLPAAGSLPKATYVDFQLINFNENFEVAFFTSLLNNITANAPGYVISNAEENAYAKKVLNTVIGQEEVHSLTAQAILKSQGAAPFLPCRYRFPTTTFEGAVGLAATFTSVVNGALSAIIQDLATYGLAPVAATIGSVIGQEGEQAGLYRAVLKKVPSEAPFLTAGVRDFAWTFLQSVVVPGSCPGDYINQVPLKIYAPLNVLTPPGAADTTVRYSFDVSTIAGAKLPKHPGWTAQTNFAHEARLVLINQQNVPLVLMLKNVQVSGHVITFEADWPFSKFLLYGVTLASVVIGQGPFASAQAVADVAVFAPGIIVVD